MSETTPVRAELVEPSGDEARLTRIAGMFLATYRNPNTRRGYSIDLRSWFDWCRQWQIDPLGAVKRTHVDVWLHHLEDAGYAAGTRARKIAATRSFYNFCVEEEILPSNPLARIKRPKAERKPQPAYNRTQMSRLLDAAEKAGGTDQALVMLLFVNGLRISEVCSADVEDLGEDRWHHTLTIKGKGDKVEAVPLPPPVILALKGALDGREEGPLLLTQFGTRMNRNAATRTLARLAKAAGVHAVTPHALRRTAIQLMIADGTSLRDAQAFARHAEPTTTAIYDHRIRSLDEHPAYGVLRVVT